MADPEKTGTGDSKPARVEVPAAAQLKAHANVYAALSAFQGEMKPIAKSSHVEFAGKNGGIVKFDYTPLGEIMTTIYPLLAKHGLAIRHEITEEGIEAILTHSTFKVSEAQAVRREYAENGETLKSIEYVAGTPENEIRSGIVKLKGAGESMKDTGAAITYARRYTLTMVLGISSEEDKDAELLEGSAKNAQSFAESKARQGIENAKTEAEVEKAINVIKKDLELVKKGKPGALGLTKEKYEELIEMGIKKVEALKNPADIGA